MRHLHDWRVALILAAGLMLGACRTTPPLPSPDRIMRPSPFLPLLPGPKGPPRIDQYSRDFPPPLAVTPREAVTPWEAVTPQETKPRPPWGSPGDCVTPRLEYKPLMYGGL